MEGPAEKLKTRLSLMVGKPLSKGDIGDIKMPRPCRNGVVGYYNGKSLEMSMARV
jgi:hypothetical protein